MNIKPAAYLRTADRLSAIDNVHCRTQAAKFAPVWAIELVFTMSYNRPRWA